MAFRLRHQLKLHKVDDSADVAETWGVARDYLDAAVDTSPMRAGDLRRTAYTTVIAYDGAEIKSIIDAIRRRYRPMTLIVLSLLKHGAPEHLRMCLITGADDFQPHDITMLELNARMTAISRRHSGHESSLITVGPLVWDMNQRALIVDNDTVYFTTQETKILEVLIRNPNRCISKEMMLSTIYGGMPEEPEQKILDVFMCKIRTQLQKHGIPKNTIQTLWGRGWMIETQPELAAEVKAA